MVTFENIGQRIRNLPSYIRHTLKTKKNAPFHWTATQNQRMLKGKLMNNRLSKKNANRQLNKRVNVYCEELNGKESMSFVEKRYYNQHCVTPENLQNVVNLNEANLSPLPNQRPPRSLKEHTIATMRKFFKTPVPKSAFPYLPEKPNNSIYNLRRNAVENWKGGKTRRRNRNRNRRN